MKSVRFSHAITLTWTTDMFGNDARIDGITGRPVGPTNELSLLVTRYPGLHPGLGYGPALRADDDRPRPSILSYFLCPHTAFPWSSYRTIHQLPLGFEKTHGNGGSQIETAYFGTYWNAQRPIRVSPQQRLWQAKRFLAEDQHVVWPVAQVGVKSLGSFRKQPQIGRASCRERV